VQRIEEAERHFGIARGGVRELGPRRLVVRLDRRILFRERELEARVGVQVAVGDVVDELVYGPPARAIRSLPAVGSESGDGGAQPARERLDAPDVPLALLGRPRSGAELEAADGIAKITRLAHGMLTP
jgi:hypothetical protein